MKNAGDGEGAISGIFLSSKKVLTQLYQLYIMRIYS